MAALAAAGCTSGPGGTADIAGTTAPPVTLAQARQAFGSYVATSELAARTGDEALALSDVSGVQQAQVSYSFKAYRSSRTPLPYAGFSYTAPAFYLPASAGYPRWFAASVTRTSVTRTSRARAGAGLPASQPVVLLFEQASPAARWRLVSTSAIGDGVSVPALAANGNGQAPVLTMSQTAGLLVRPDVVGPLVAAVVDDGPSSPAAGVVTYSGLIARQYAGARDGLSAPHGDVHQWELEGTSYTPFAIRTKDGGALVFFAMYLNNTVEVPGELNQSVPPFKPGPPITVPAELKAMLPAGTTPRLQLETQDLLSFVAVDPPAGQGKIQVIAQGGGLNYASAS
jgi:hypothetical protein